MSREDALVVIKDVEKECFKFWSQFCSNLREILSERIALFHTKGFIVCRRSIVTAMNLRSYQPTSTSLFQCAYKAHAADVRSMLQFAHHLLHK